MMKKLKLFTFLKAKIKSINLRSKAIWSFTIGLGFILLILTFASKYVLTQDKTIEKMYNQVALAINDSLEITITFSKMDKKFTELILLDNSPLINKKSNEINKLDVEIYKRLISLKKHTSNLSTLSIIKILEKKYMNLVKARNKIFNNKSSLSPTHVELLNKWNQLPLKIDLYRLLDKVSQYEKDDGLTLKNNSDYDYQFFWKVYLTMLTVMIFFNFFLIRMFIKNVITPILYLSNFLKKATYDKNAIAEIPLEPELAKLTTSINNFIYQKNRSYKEIIKEKNLVEQLVHVLCHDIKNPISACISYIYLCQRKPKDPKKVFEYLLGFLNHGINITESVGQIIALNDGKVKINLRPIKVSEVINESEKTLESRLTKKNITIKKINLDQHYILTDKNTLINSVLNNLLTNAIKFSQEGSCIKIEVVDASPVIEIHIRDYGIGIPPALLKIIFEMDLPTTRKGTNGEKGTGFGMPLVKRFMESYEGGIDIRTWVKDKKIDQPDENGETGTEVILQFWDGSFSKNKKSA